MKSSIILIGVLFGIVFAAGGGPTKGQWQVNNTDSGTPCIIFYGQIDLDLSYYTTVTEGEKDGHFTVPATSTVNQAKSSCKGMTAYGSEYVSTQTMHLDFDHMPGWSMLFIFSTDERFQTHGNEWALIQVNVTANYSSYPDQFPNPSVTSHTYSSPVDLKGETSLADYVFAHLSNSLYCPSQQKYIINDDTKIGPKATMTLSRLQVQAYMETINYGSKLPFGTKEICTTDQHVTDKVPIIVGSVLAGLVIFTMVAYLIYRACLPDEIIQLVNPHSHHENKAMTWEEEEEEEGSHNGLHSGHSSHNSHDGHI